MISVFQAESFILNSAKQLPMESVALTEAAGRLLREDIYSDRHQPPFDKALMDGIAIHTGAYDKGVREFVVEKVIAAGDKPYKLKKAEHCVQIMTGAVLPQGVNTVVPVEQVQIQTDMATLKDWTLIKPKQNIRFLGTDAKKGQLLIKAGGVIRAPHIGVLASVGKNTVKVTCQPKIAIISTGDELIAINKKPQDYQTRISNSYALKALIDSSQLATTEIFHYPDNKKVMLSGIAKNLKEFDILVLSGGVSMGEFDYVPEVLKVLKVNRLFHKVAQKPGKPLWFGKTNAGKIVFALPGNPVSTQICAYRYLIPFLRKLAGLKNDQTYVSLLQLPKVETDLTSFIPVQVSEKNGVKYAQVVSTGGSGDFSALAQADGFIEYEQSRKTLWPYFSWRV